MSRRDQRFRILLVELRRQIETAMAPGENLPSERELAVMHGVGPTTIHRALQELMAQGCVKPRPKVGWHRALAKGAPAPGSAQVQTRKREPLTVGLMTRRAADEWSKSEIYPALLNEARKRDIRIVSIPNPHRQRGTPRLNQIELSRVPWNTFDVGLLVESEDTIRTRDPLLQEHRVLAVDQDATEYGIDSVGFADAQGGALAAKFLLELGHKRFAVTDEVNEPGYPCDPACLARRHGFEAVIGEAGGLLLPQWRLPVARRGLQRYSHAHTVRTSVTAWAEAPPSQRPTALFAIIQAPLQMGGLLAELAKHGLRVPQEFSVLASTWGGNFYGGEAPEQNGVRFTSIDFNIALLVRRVFDAAQELAAEERPPGNAMRRAAKLFLAPATLIAGQSTGSPPR